MMGNMLQIANGNDDYVEIFCMAMIIIESR